MRCFFSKTDWLDHERLHCQIEEIWDGSENIFSEMLDAKAALNAFICIDIYAHPQLAKFLIDYYYKAYASGAI